jgi:Radical SAM superfamily
MGLDLGAGEHSHTLRRLSVCIINPRYEPSYWGFDFALPLTPGRKRYSNVTGALPALAALAPPHCDVELIDENIEPIDFRTLARFDVIGVTGMIVQGARMREILHELAKLPATVVVGGAYVSVSEATFADHCDVRFIGEAEETWPAFLTALAAGAPIAARYEQADKTDMTKVPPPRFDLVKADLYQLASLQFSRGCPFLCEFCDIIAVFGRKPRVKTVAQMMAEFDAVQRAGFQSCFLSDDNFIGNKKEAKVLLRALVAWQRERGYPLQFYTEASVNLADDAELLDLMAVANFRQVFIGIESPRRASLAETRKVQNIQGDGLEAKIQRVRDAGLVVVAGFIVGFDNDDETIFDEQFEFIQRTGIAPCRRGSVDADPDHAALCAARGRGTAGFHRSRRDLSSQADESRDAQARLWAAVAPPVRAGGIFRTAVPGISRFAGVSPSARSHGCGGVAPARGGSVGPPNRWRRATSCQARARVGAGEAAKQARYRLRQGLARGEFAARARRPAVPPIRPRLRGPLAFLQCYPIAAQNQLWIDRDVAPIGRQGPRCVMSFSECASQDRDDPLNHRVRQVRRHRQFDEAGRQRIHDPQGFPCSVAKSAAQRCIRHRGARA